MLAQCALRLWQLEPVHSSPDDDRQVAMQQNTNTMKCNLCLERKPTTTTVCGHLFCWFCIVEWLQGQHHCPLCREPMSPSRIVRLMNLWYTSNNPVVQKRHLKDTQTYALYTKIASYVICRALKRLNCYNQWRINMICLCGRPKYKHHTTIMRRSSWFKDLVRFSHKVVRWTERIPTFSAILLTSWPNPLDSELSFILNPIVWLYAL